MKTILTTLSALLLSTAATFAAPGDPVTGKANLTWLEAARLIAPDAKAAGDVIEASRTIRIRHMDGDRDSDPGAPARFGAFEARDIRVGGKNAVAVLFGVAPGNSGNPALLAVVETGATPKLLGVVDVQADRDTMLLDGGPRLSPGDDAIVVSNTHHNSNQGYRIDTLLYVHGGQLRKLEDVQMMRLNMCSYETDQTAAFSVTPRPGARFGDLRIRITETLKTRERCSGEKRPRKGGPWEAVYRWDEKRGRFVTSSPAMKRLAAHNEKLM